MKFWKLIIDLKEKKKERNMFLRNYSFCYDTGYIWESHLIFKLTFIIKFNNERKRKIFYVPVLTSTPCYYDYANLVITTGSRC